MVTKRQTKPVQSIHLRRAQWILNLLEGIPEDSELARRIADWYSRSGYHDCGYEWLQLPVPGKFPRAEALSKKERAAVSSTDDEAEKAWKTNSNFFDLRGLERRKRRTAMLKELLQRRLREAVKATTHPSAFEQNIDFIARKLKLPQGVEDYLLLIADIESSNRGKEALEQTIDYLWGENPNTAYKTAIAVMIGQPLETIQEWTKAGSVLDKSGITQLNEPTDKPRLFYKSAPNEATLSRFFLKLINRPALHDDNLAQEVFEYPVVPKLQREQFAYMRDHLDMAIQFVVSVRDGKWKDGCSLALEGAPGVGKSQMVGVIAKEADVPFYYLGRSKDDNRRADNAQDTEMTRKDLLAELRFKNRIALRLGIKAGFVLEEADGILRQSLVRESDKNTKGHLNTILEELAYPVIFTTNYLGDMERATIRRILPVIPVEMQPDTIIADHMASLCKSHSIEFSREQALDLIERYPGMSIGEVERITLLTCAGCGDDAERKKAFAEKLELAMRLGRRALNGGLEEPASKTVIPDNYDSSLTPLSLPYAAVCHAFKHAVQHHTQTPRLALVGQAGSGKRTLARDILQQAGMRVNELHFMSLMGLDAYSDICELFQSAAASQKALLVSGAQKLLLNEDANRDFLFLRVMKAFDVPIIMTADIYPQNDRFSYNYHAQLENGEKPKNASIVKGTVIPTIPLSLRENFSLIVQFSPLQDALLRRAYFNITGEDCGEVSQLPKDVTLGDLVSVRRQLDFLNPVGDQRKDVALSLLRQITSPLLSSEHSIEQLDSHVAPNGSSAGGRSKPLRLN